MDAEAPAGPSSKRPRTSLLVLLGIVVALGAIMSLRNSTGPPSSSSNPGRGQQQAGAAGKIEPEQLNVNVEKLKDQPPSPGDADRNPFRFKPKAAPPPAPTAKRPEKDTLTPTPPPAPPQLPAIPWKFIGVTDAPGVGRIAALTDCRHTIQGMEGQEIEGRYRIVKIGVESLVIEYLDGRGRTTLRMSGQECVGK